MIVWDIQPKKKHGVVRREEELHRGKTRFFTEKDQISDKKLRVPPSSVRIDKTMFIL
jgi:hypothetical protein